MIMLNTRTSKLKNLSRQNGLAIGFFLLLINSTFSWASIAEITDLNFSSISGGKLQIQLGMKGNQVEPKIFQTDNPARIALDFKGVRNGLNSKMFKVDQGSVSAIYVMETKDRTRVIINLTDLVPYKSRYQNDKFILTLQPKSLLVSPARQVQNVSQKSSEPATAKQVEIKKRPIEQLIPEQLIQKIDFRRGGKGEGRLIVKLSNPNTIVDVKEIGSKVVLNFINTKLPVELQKSFDVSDFATPVNKIVAQGKGKHVAISISPFSGNYDYASFQSEGIFTVEFIPLTPAEKEALKKDKFPYTGNKLSLNFQDIEVRSVLQILADFTELNIIASDSVDGTVTLRLNDVPWDQALDLILKSKGLAKRKTGNVVLVAPSSEIIKIEEEELAAQKVVEQLEPLRTEYIQVNYAKAEDMQDLLVGRGVVGSNSANQGNQGNSQGGGGSGGNRSGGGSSGGGGSGASFGGSGQGSNQRGIISKRGSVTVDSRTNTLIVKDTSKRLQDVRELLKLLDVPVRQVLIESRIVIASTSFAQELGVRFGIAQDVIDIGGGKSFTLGASGVESGSVLNDLAGALAASSGGSLAMTLARGADYVLNLEISALQDDGETELLSNPRVMTTDRVEATIKQGVQIPFQTQSQDGPVTELVDAVLELRVLPQITPSGSVIMDLNIKNDAPGSNISTGGELTVAIDTREVTTTVQVEDGETIVLGGIYEGSTNSATNKVPWFADLPGIGWMFRRKNEVNTRRELLIFVTPKIVKNTVEIR